MARKSASAVSRPNGGSEPLPKATATRKLLWLAASAIWLYALAALASFSSSDWPSHTVAVQQTPPHNLGGTVGAIVAYGLYEGVGFGIWVPMFCSAYALLVIASGRAIPHPIVRGIGALLAMLSVSALHALWFPSVGTLAGAEAGLLPGWMADQLWVRFGPIGSSIIVLAGCLIGFVVAIDEVVMAIPSALVKAFQALDPVWGFDYRGLFGRLIPHRKGSQFQPATTAGAVPVGADVEDEKGSAQSALARRRRLLQQSRQAATAASLGTVVEAADDSEATEAYLATAESLQTEGPDDSKETPETQEVSARPVLSNKELRDRISKMPVRMTSTTKVVARDQDIPREVDYTGYRFPTLDLLDDPESNFSQRMEVFVREQAGVLTETLRMYQLDGEVVGIESGPVVTLYSVELAPGTRVARLETIAKDIARALSAPNIRIIANMAGKTAVGIEVPNRQKEKVRLKELMSGGHAEGMRLPMFLGKDSSGEPMVLDLTRMPHVLIAGTTGSGKSVCINSIIMSWLYTKRPDELKLVLVDPKMVEMSQFADIPHLMAPVVTDMNQAAGILQWTVTRMEERYDLFRRTGVRDIAGYNALEEAELYERLGLTDDVERARIPKKLPYLVFVIDELADLVLTNKEVEAHIVRIAQKARAVGIHLVLATQRPQANVVTGLIKANMPCRIGFKVASGMDSRIVLDQKGAELLLGQGDMMVLTPTNSELRRSQATLVTDGETRRVVNFLKDVAGPSFERSLLAIKTSAQGDPEAGGELDPDERDPLFDKAVEVLIETGRGSVSLLQRRLAIGYGRASRLVDQMSLAGILSDHKGSVAREVLITADEWERMRAMESGNEVGADSSDQTEQTLEPADET
ncbi:MAG: DNA translocase FtsK [Phycisphaerales bacterium]|nr:DNA translocase FtsK [Phycisphaerales bacterium]